MTVFNFIVLHSHIDGVTKYSMTFHSVIRIIRFLKLMELFMHCCVQIHQLDGDDSMQSRCQLWDVSWVTRSKEIVFSLPNQVSPPVHLQTLRSSSWQRPKFSFRLWCDSRRGSCASIDDVYNIFPCFVRCLYLLLLLINGNHTVTKVTTGIMLPTISIIITAMVFSK